ncbi:hypothetical protein V6N11_077508 [Hibiscus sabdariffa]|uniref:Uncharacterized protein n=1 Tax=Hibiscus sabdariffa TaxID=183260 RepID=A0ABR2TE69_9ROSI
MEIPSKGRIYTWSNQRSDEDAILEKLDKALSSREWGFLFPKAISIIDIAIASDHSPIVLLTNGLMKKVKRDFKFELRWLIEDECSRVVHDEQENRGNNHSSGTFQVKLRSTRVKLSKYNKEKFGKNKLSANDILNKIKEVQDGP